MTVRLVGGGGVRCCVLRIDGPGSGMMSVSSPPACVLGGALAGGGGGASAGGKLTVRWAWATPVSRIKYRRGSATCREAEAPAERRAYGALEAQSARREPRPPGLSGSVGFI